MRTSRLGRLAALALVVLGFTVMADTGTEAAYVASTDNTGNQFLAIPDWRPPITSRATVQKSEGGIPGYVRQGGSYSVLASVGDDQSSNPPAGLSSVTGNVSSVTVGETATPLSAAAGLVVGGLSYTHRSAALTVPVGRAASTYTNSITAADLVTPPNTSTFSFSTVVDNTSPTRTSAIVTNGGTAGRMDAGDRIVYLWSEIIDPESVLAGWDGTSTPVTVQVNNAGGSRGDTVMIRDAANTVQLPLGSVETKVRDFVTQATTIGGPGNATRSTMLWNATNGAITVTFGAPDVPAVVTTTGTNSGTYEWIPQVVFDRAGNLSNTTSYNETGALDRDF